MILIDSRERLTEPTINVLKKQGMPFEVLPLDTGDYRVFCDNGLTVCIEHKRAADLLMSMKDDHLRAQCALMLEKFEHVRLVISGQWMQAGPHLLAPLGPKKLIFNTIDVRRMVGYLSSLQEAGVLVDWWPVWECIGEYLLTIKRRYEEGDRDHLIRPRRFTFTRRTGLMDAVQRLQIPGVGGGRAEKLAAAFPDLRALAAADLVTLQKLMGKVTGQRIHEFFGAPEVESREVA